MLSGKDRILTLDSEAVGLLPAIRRGDRSSMHVIVCKDFKTKQVFKFFDPYELRDPDAREELEAEGTQDGDLLEGIKFINQADAIISQNFMGYDHLAFEKAFPDVYSYNYREARGKGRAYSDLMPFKVVDTYILSSLLNPDRKVPPQAYHIGRGNVGAHSIEAHGIRMGRYKPDNEDWSKLTDHMLHRCEEDVHIGEDFFVHLMKEWEEHLSRGKAPRTGLTIKDAYRMEMQMAMMIARQAERGFRFDAKRGYERYLQIDREMEVVAEKVAPFIPPQIVKKPVKDTHLNQTYKGLKLLQAEGRKGLGAVWKEYLAEYNEGVFTHTSELMPVWSLTKKNGDYSAAVQKHYPEMRGNINDTVNPKVAGAFTPVRFKKKELGSLEWIKEKVLYPLGWRGVNYSDTEIDYIEEHGETKNPWSGKIDDDSVEAWKQRDGEIPEFAEMMCDWYVNRSRRSQLLNKSDVEYFAEHKRWPKQATLGREGCRGLLARMYCKEYGMEGEDYYAKFGRWPDSYDEDWRTPAQAFPIGTNTHRMRHKVVVNIPSRGLNPLRDLFIASKGHYVLGADGAGLELRMLAHFMADAIYTEIVLNGDIHTHNQQLAGLPERDIAKTFIYAFLYGSGVDNLAAVTGMSRRQMSECIERFKEELPALATLIERVEKAAKNHGYFMAVDGRWGRVRRKGGQLLIHTCLNVLLQMTGSLAMKWGECLADDKMYAEGVMLDEHGHPAWVANVHDEVQAEVPIDEVEEVTYQIPKGDWKKEEKRKHYEGDKLFSAPKVIEEVDDTLTIRRRYHRAGQIIIESFQEAGRLLAMRIPLDGEYMIGSSWAETH